MHWKPTCSARDSHTWGPMPSERTSIQSFKINWAQTAGTVILEHYSEKCCLHLYSFQFCASCPSHFNLRQCWTMKCCTPNKEQSNKGWVKFFWVLFTPKTPIRAGDGSVFATQVQSPQPRQSGWGEVILKATPDLYMDQTLQNPHP